MKIVCLKIILNREVAWAREIIQNLRLRLFWPQDINFWDKIFKLINFSGGGGKVTSQSYFFPIQNSLFKNIFGHKTLFVNRFPKNFPVYFTSN